MTESLSFDYLFQKDLFIELLKKYQFHLSPELGQNFLVNVSLRKNLIDMIPTTDCIVEIGCGLGHFTAFLFTKTTFLLGIEIDKGFFHYLKEAFQNHLSVEFLHQNILTVTQEQLKKSLPIHNSCTLVGNLPYHISSDILIHCLSFAQMFDQIFFMFQKEFIQNKLLFKKNSRGLSFIYSVLEPYFEIFLLRYIPKESFFPIPKVDSGFIQLTPKPVNFYQSLSYYQYCATLFKDPLKLISTKFTSLKIHKDKMSQILKSLDISDQVRIQHLQIEEIQQIYQEIHHYFNGEPLDSQK